MDAKPEDLIHNEIGILQVANFTAGHIFEGRLAGEVPAKKQACVYSALVKITDEVIACKGSICSYSQGKIKNSWSPFNPS
jgi:hypothetical protein